MTKIYFNVEKALSNRIQKNVEKTRNVPESSQKFRENDVLHNL